MRALPFAALLLTAALTQTAERGVFVDDIDRKADACTSFFDYANGAWRAANPIPASMDRWSRRWVAGEQSKEQLRVLLDDVSKRKDWPKGSIDQQIGDRERKAVGSGNRPTYTRLFEDVGPHRGRLREDGRETVYCSARHKFRTVGHNFLTAGTTFWSVG
jgi:hypothetical protein